MKKHQLEVEEQDEKKKEEGEKRGSRQGGRCQRSSTGEVLDQILQIAGDKNQQSHAGTTEKTTSANDIQRVRVTQLAVLCGVQPQKGRPSRYMLAECYGCLWWVMTFG